MALHDALLLLVTGIASMCLGVVSVVAFSRRGSRSTPPKKSAHEDSPTENLRAALASLQADQAELYATLEKLTTTVKRLSSRAGMRELREQQNDHESSLPPNASKAEVLRHLGLAGKVGPAFAQAQLELETRNKRPN